MMVAVVVVVVVAVNEHAQEQKVPRHAFLRSTMELTWVNLISGSRIGSGKLMMNAGARWSCEGKII